MMPALPYLLVAFLAGFLTCEALRITHDRRLAAALLPHSDVVNVDAACQQWAADPAFWCNRPGCARCWDAWGRP